MPALWRPYYEWKCRREVEIPQLKHPAIRGGFVCFVKFPTYGMIKEDGSDVRVVSSSGRTLRSTVIWMGPGDYASVAFEVPPSVNRAYIYFANPNARKMEVWKPEYGLWLETRKYTGGDCTSYVNFTKTMARAKYVFGKGPVPYVFHGFNMFGPSDNYISIYRGKLWSPKTGSYVFSTTSDDISYIMIDGRVVAQKRRWGWAPRVARYQGKPVTLSAGLHSFEYLHVEGTGDQRAVAAWRMPGMRRRFKLIEPKYFPGVVRGKLGSFEIRTLKITPDFESENRAETGIGKLTFYHFVFRDRTSSVEALKYQPLWQFGDGTLSTLRNPQHIYLTPGLYTVKLSLKRGPAEYSVSLRLKVETAWEKQATRRFESLGSIYEIIKDYQFDRMNTTHLKILANVFERLEKPFEIIKVCQVLRSRKLEEGERFKYLMLLGTRLREAKKDIEGAMNIFSEILNSSKQNLHKAHALKELGDTLYYYYLKYDEALERYRTVVEKYADLRDPVLRLCQIRIGDIYRDRGDYEKAFGVYKLVEDTTLSSMSFAQRIARQGAYPQSVEEYIRSGRYELALQTLNKWEWDFPLEKLRGYSSYLRAKLALQQSNYEEALKQALALVRINRKSDWADRCLLVAGEAYLSLSKPGKALDVVEVIRRDYPETPFSDETLLLEAKALFTQGNYAEAAKKMMEFVSDEQNKESQILPECLLLAGRSYIAIKEYGRAKSVLQTILRYYPEKEAEVEELRKELRK